MVDVRNTGARKGEEVVQLYIRDEVSAATRPIRELRGFERITLAPGETRTVSFKISAEHLSYHDPGMKRVVEPGQFQLMVGGSPVDVQSIALIVDPAPVPPARQ